MHRDAKDPERLVARISALTGLDLAGRAETIELVHQLATIFYQLGKAYVLLATDPDHHLRVFEEAWPVEPTQNEGRGFVDGVLLSGRADPAEQAVDWEHARHLLNGQLKQIVEPLEKGRRLLTEAIESDPSHEEARLYLAYLHAHEGKTLKAAEEYRELFRTALCPANRGHAAVQLGILHDGQQDHRKALACFRWVTISGLADSDERFFFARFNIGLEHALLGDQERALAAFRLLLDHHRERISEVALAFARSQRLHATLESQPGFAEALLQRCPELFQAPENGDPEERPS
jgi:tetratricopeptide (TPR) repeat protein